MTRPPPGRWTPAHSYVTATATFYQEGLWQTVLDADYGRVDAIGQSSDTPFFDTSGNLIVAADGNPLVAEGAPPVWSTDVPSTHLVNVTQRDTWSAGGLTVVQVNNSGVVTSTQSDLAGRTIGTKRRARARSTTTTNTAAWRRRRPTTPTPAASCRRRRRTFTPRRSIPRCRPSSSLPTRRTCSSRIPMVMAIGRSPPTTATTRRRPTTSRAHTLTTTDRAALSMPSATTAPGGRFPTP